MFEQVLLQLVGALVGQVDTQPNEASSPGAQSAASPAQALSQLPQDDDNDGLRQPPSHASRPSAQPLSAPPSSAGPASASSPPVATSIPVAIAPSWGFGWTLASHPSSGHSSDV